jgi:hypothetical protein
MPEAARCERVSWGSGIYIVAFVRQVRAHCRISRPKCGGLREAILLSN